VSGRRVFYSLHADHYTMIYTSCIWAWRGERGGEPGLRCVKSRGGDARDSVFPAP
jgi:hypothetical protein